MLGYSPLPHLHHLGLLLPLLLLVQQGQQQGEGPGRKEPYNMLDWCGYLQRPSVEPVMLSVVSVRSCKMAVSCSVKTRVSHLHDVPQQSEVRVVSGQLGCQVVHH